MHLDIFMCFVNTIIMIVLSVATKEDINRLYLFKTVPDQQVRIILATVNVAPGCKWRFETAGLWELFQRASVCPCLNHAAPISMRGVDSDPPATLNSVLLPE